MTIYGDVYAEHSANNALADKVNKLQRVLVKHIGNLDDKDKLKFRLQIDFVNQTLYLMNIKKAEIKTIKEQHQYIHKSNTKNYYKSAIIAFIIYLFLYFTNASIVVQATFFIALLGFTGIYQLGNLIFNHYAMITNKINSDAYELLSRDLIANGLTMRDSYNYEVKKAQIEALVVGQFKEMGVLEFEYESCEREMKVLSSNYNFKREDDFYGA
jgi:hypothetical protein